MPQIRPIVKNAHGRADLKIVSFNIYPEKDRRYFYKVVVFPDHAAMHAYFRSARGQGDKFVAVTLSWPLDVCRKLSRNSKNKRRCMGEILFDLTCVGAEIVTHEMTHAATHYAELKKINPFKNAAQNERFADIQGNLVHQMVKRLRMQKIYRKKVAAMYRLPG